VIVTEDGSVSLGTDFSAGTSWSTTITLTPGTHSIVAIGVDGAGNRSASSTALSITVDTAAPIITIVGTNPIRIHYRGVYSDSGATATDLNDGDLTSLISTVDSINTLVPSLQTVTYNVTDAAGNAAVEAVRNVTVFYSDSGGGASGGGGSYTPAPLATPSVVPTVPIIQPIEAPILFSGSDIMAQIEVLMAQLRALQARSSTLSNLPVAGTYTISGASNIRAGLDLGSRGENVTLLQRLLAQDKEIYPEGLVTGFYGNLTRQAVQAFQMKYGVVSSASDAGYGYVGPKTRAKLIEVFGN
jgi:hypothetical protein